MKKSFGIIGTGNIGQTVARHLLKAGYPVILSNSRGPDSLNEIVTALGGATAGTVEEAANADIVLLSLPWPKIPTITNLINWNNRIVIDATNHFVSHAPTFQLADLGGRTSSEVVSDLLPGARIVKAFNTLYFKILGLDPQDMGGRRVIFISGDDVLSKTHVGDVISSLGFAVVDLGDLANGGKLQQPKAPLATLNLIRLD